MIKKKTKKRYIVFVLQIAAAFTLALCDQVIKSVVTAKIPKGTHIDVIKGVIGLTYTRNTGAAFSIFSDSTLALSIVTLIMLIALVVYLFLSGFESRTFNIAAAMILGGGTGNLIDRFAKGYVVDYIETLFIDFPIFNFADILVTVGVITVCIYLIYDIVREEKEKKKSKNEHGDA